MGPSGSKEVSAPESKIPRNNSMSDGVALKTGPPWNDMSSGMAKDETTLRRDRYHVTEVESEDTTEDVQVEPGLDEERRARLLAVARQTLQQQDKQRVEAIAKAKAAIDPKVYGIVKPAPAPAPPQPTPTLSKSARKHRRQKERKRQMKMEAEQSAGWSAQIATTEKAGPSRLGTIEEAPEAEQQITTDDEVRETPESHEPQPPGADEQATADDDCPEETYQLPGPPYYRPCQEFNLRVGEEYMRRDPMALERDALWRLMREHFGKKDEEIQALLEDELNTNSNWRWTWV